MWRIIVLAGLLSSALPAAGRAAVAAPDPAATMQRIASAPYRYGGEVQGLPIGDRRILHLAIGLAAPRPDGALQGEAILFDAGRRLVGIAGVDGNWIAETGHCRLRFAFPDGDTVLDGTCADATLAGELVSTPRAASGVAGALSALLAWWGDRTVDGRAWLTAASFDPRP